LGGRRRAGLVAVRWGASTEVVTGRRLVLFVALNTSCWGRRFRRGADADRGRGCCRPVSARSWASSPSATWDARSPTTCTSHDTIRTHVRHTMTKVGARSREHLVANALRDDLLD
jgi:hypothetical protein